RPVRARSAVSEDRAVGAIAVFREYRKRVARSKPGRFRKAFGADRSRSSECIALDVAALIPFLQSCSRRIPLPTGGPRFHPYSGREFGSAILCRRDLR